VTSQRLFVFVGGLALRETVAAGDVRAYELAGVRWGREIPEVVPAVLIEHGWDDFRFPGPAWLATTGDWGKASLVIVDDDEADPDAQLAESSQLRAMARAIRFIDLLTLIKGGTPRVVASVFAARLAAGGWEALALSAPSAARTGSDLRALLPDHAEPRLLTIDEASMAVAADPRLVLWLRLFRGACQTDGWDARTFQLFVLLDVIGQAHVTPRQPVLANNERPLRNDNGKPATTSQPRGRLYQLVQQSLAAGSVPQEAVLAHPDHSLWHEIGIWLDIRDTVAHEGSWTPDGRRGASWERVRAAASTAARGGGLDEGVLRYERAIGAAAEIVLHAAIGWSAARLTAGPAGEGARPS
jgi:hypothetical protein